MSAVVFLTLGLIKRIRILRTPEKTLLTEQWHKEKDLRPKTYSG